MNIKRAFLILLATMLLPTLAMAQAVTITPAEGTAIFVVQKHFLDGNFDQEVTFHMDCSTGLPTEQQRTVSSEFPGFEVAFVLGDIPTSPNQNGVTCTIYEEEVGGYTANYRCAGPSDSNFDQECAVGSPTACVFYNVESSEQTGGEGHVNYCSIRNEPNPAEIDITKEWVVEGTIGFNPEYAARISVKSNAPFQGANYDGQQYKRWVMFDKGPGSETKTLSFYPGYKGANIWVSEDVFDSIFETDNDCEGTMKVYPEGFMGDDGFDSCTFTNTAYFEGIPTLNQYGMAIMILLMMGVGFIGFRRFA